MFNERYGLQSAVFEGRKTQTRREPFYYDKEIDLIISPYDGHLYAYKHCRCEYVHKSRYAVGEIVAIAQSYSEIADEMKDAICAEELGKFYVKPFIDTKGWNNKMFVRADIMPHHIKITDIRCERLQDISESDSIKEGIYIEYDGHSCYFIDNHKVKKHIFLSPKFAFRELIYKLNGKKSWDTNPYVIVYEFEYID